MSPSNLIVREAATATVTGMVTVDHVSASGFGVRTVPRSGAFVLAVALLVGIAVIGWLSGIFAVLLAGG